jgi:hypothetical protein
LNSGGISDEKGPICGAVGSGEESFALHFSAFRRCLRLQQTQNAIATTQIPREPKTVVNTIARTGTELREDFLTGGDVVANDSAIVVLDDDDDDDDDGTRSSLV